MTDQQKFEQGRIAWEAQKELFKKHGTEYLIFQAEEAVKFFGADKFIENQRELIESMGEDAQNMFKLSLYYLEKKGEFKTKQN